MLARCKRGIKSFGLNYQKTHYQQRRRRYANSQIGNSGEVSPLMVGASHLLRVPLSAGGALECWGFRLMPSMAGKEESRPHC